MTARPEGKCKRGSVRLIRDKRLTLPMRKMEVPSCHFSDDGDIFEITFLEGVLRRDPSHEEALEVLGSAYTARATRDVPRRRR